MSKLPKIGDMRGKWILINRVKNPDGTFTDTWVLDDVITLHPTTGTHPAYNKASSNSTSTYDSPDNATTEFTTEQYTNVQSEDGNYASISSTSTIQDRYSNVAQLFKFNTSGYAGITNILVYWKGYRSGDVPDEQKLQVYKATAWEDWLTSIPTSNTEESKSLGNGSAYLYSSTWIRFGLYMYKYRDTVNITITLNSDYASIQITCVNIVVPTVTTQDADNIDAHNGTLNGNITNTGGENCNQRGFDWGTQSGVYPYDWTENGSFGTGAFSHQITGLDRNKTYYFRAKAHNSAGWGYGSEKSFTTLKELPVVTTQDATDIGRD
jgi:hypothetical protein